MTTTTPFIDSPRLTVEYKRKIEVDEKWMKRQRPAAAHTQRGRSITTRCERHLVARKRTISWAVAPAQYSRAQSAVLCCFAPNISAKMTSWLGGGGGAWSHLIFARQWRCGRCRGVFMWGRQEKISSKLLDRVLLQSVYLVEEKLRRRRQQQQNYRRRRRHKMWAPTTETTRRVAQ